MSSLPCHISKLFQGCQEGVIIDQRGRTASKLAYSDQRMLHTVCGYLLLKGIHLRREGLEVLRMRREKARSKNKKQAKHKMRARSLHAN